MLISEEMAALALEPYRFEPKRVCDVADDDSGKNNEINERLNSTFWSFWCFWQRCEVMLTPKEYICCVGTRNRKTGWKVPILLS